MRVFATTGSTVYHDSHGGIKQVRWWDSPAAAEADGLRPCKVCKPASHLLAGYEGGYEQGYEATEGS